MEPVLEAARAARQDYNDHKPIRTILAKTNLSLTKYYYWPDGAP